MVAARRSHGSLTDVGVRRLAVAELPFQRRRPGIDGVGFPDRLIDAVVTVRVRPYAHVLRRLALRSQDTVDGRVEVIRRLRAGRPLVEPVFVAAEVDISRIVVLVDERTV